MNWLYLILNLGSVSIPLFYSFKKEIPFLKFWKYFLMSTTIVALFFLIWDVIFTYYGIWGFNSNYYLGFKILNMPFEEWMFFFCIPYASIFIHYSLKFFKPKFILSLVFVRFLIVAIFLLCFSIIVLENEKAYSLFNFSVLAVTMVLAMLFGQNILRRFFVSFLIILLPFFLVNGILTGSFITEPIVWYNDEEILGIRVFTIPVEDIGYAFSLLFLNILIFENIKKIPKNDSI